jgi:lipoprotein-anchoring transpeptidase ErfK/SrfK
MSFTTLIAASILGMTFMVCARTGEIRLSAATNPDNSVRLTLDGLDSQNLRTLYLYRSFNDLAQMSTLDLNGWPITRTIIPGTDFTGTVVDSFTAHNTTYRYYAKARLRDGRLLPSNVATTVIPDIMLPVSDKPASLFIDKYNYFLEIRFDGTGVKRFPVNVGCLPRNRKLYYDLSSTPEGIYRARYIRPVTAYHKAIGVSYPNSTDRKRYAQALRAGNVPSRNGTPVSIGGSIQIHGGGIGNNWTWGCIAMRNDDLDEIFSMPQCRTGLPITIVGSEFTRDSISRSATAKELYSLY